MKRRASHIPDEQACEQPSKRSCSTSPFTFQDNFTIPLVLSFLTDFDVLQRFIICSKAHKAMVYMYSLKSAIPMSDIDNVKNSNYQVVHVTDVTTIKQLPSLPKSVRSITFGAFFNQSLPVGIIPSSVVQVTFGYYFNQPLHVGSIPSSITHLTFDRSFNQTLQVGVIPASVTQLTFGHDFNQSLQIGFIPSSVTHLKFGVYFNQTLQPGVVPSSVTHLTFGEVFNQPLQVGDIPFSVKLLTFGRCFNQPLRVGLIPSSVKRLEFGFYIDTSSGLSRITFQFVLHNDFWHKPAIYRSVDDQSFNISQQQRYFIHIAAKTQSDCAIHDHTWFSVWFFVWLIGWLSGVSPATIICARLASSTCAVLGETGWPSWSWYIGPGDKPSNKLTR